MTHRRPNLTQEEKTLAAELREKGWSHERIARRIGCSPGSIAWHCLAVGADPPNAKPIDTSIRGPLVVMRRGKQVRRFTPDDDKQILKLTAQGMREGDIARRLGRRHNSIRGRLMTLARHDERGTSQ